MKSIFLQSTMLYPALCHPRSQCCFSTLLLTPLRGGQVCSGAARALLASYG